MHSSGIPAILENPAVFGAESEIPALDEAPADLLRRQEAWRKFRDRRRREEEAGTRWLADVGDGVRVIAADFV